MRAVLWAALLLAGALATTPRGHAADPWRSAAEETHFLRSFAILEAYRCKAISAAESEHLAVKIGMASPLTEARRTAIDDAAGARVAALARTRQPCTASAVRLARSLQTSYPFNPAAPAMPRSPNPPGSPAHEAWINHMTQAQIIALGQACDVLDDAMAARLLQRSQGVPMLTRSHTSQEIAAATAFASARGRHKPDCATAADMVLIAEERIAAAEKDAD
jgi:hypothetical protein